MKTIFVGDEKKPGKKELNYINFQKAKKNQKRFDFLPENGDNLNVSSTYGRRSSGAALRGGRCLSTPLDIPPF